MPFVPVHIRFFCVSKQILFQYLWRQPIQSLDRCRRQFVQRFGAFTVRQHTGAFTESAQNRLCFVQQYVTGPNRTMYETLFVQVLQSEKCVAQYETDNDFRESGCEEIVHCVTTGTVAHHRCHNVYVEVVHERRMEGQNVWMVKLAHCQNFILVAEVSYKDEIGWCVCVLCKLAYSPELRSFPCQLCPF